MIRIYPDYESLSHGAAELFVSLAEEVCKEGRRFSVALSGGHTPRRTYELLALPSYRDRVDWSRVDVFWGDERCVSPDSPVSNYRMARQAFLSRVPVPSSRIHPILCAESAKDAALEYEALLHSFFGDAPHNFDLVYLGLGEDGHTASLFPGTPIVGEQVRWVQHVHLVQQDMFRVSLTLPTINRASVVAFVVSGQSKARALKDVLDHQNGSRPLPACLVQPERHGGRLYWLADADAASQAEQGR